MRGAPCSGRSSIFRPRQMETGVMESTGVSGIALCAVLAERRFDVKRVAPQAVRHVPGRKTDFGRVRAIRVGARAPQRGATSRDTRGPHAHATIAQALTGHGRAAHLWAWPQAVDQEDGLA
jgi:transposase